MLDHVVYICVYIFTFIQISQSTNYSFVVYPKKQSLSCFTTHKEKGLGILAGVNGI